MRRSWYADREKTREYLELYRLRVVKGVAPRDLARIYGMDIKAISERVGSVYQWLKNGCPADVTREQLVKHERLTDLAHIGYRDIPSLKACELAWRGYQKGIRMGVMRKALAEKGIERSESSLWWMIRSCRQAEEALGMRLDFKPLKDDLVKMGLEGYGRERYTGR